MQQTTRGAYLLSSYLVWDKLQLTVFFVQETILSLLYIIETRTRLNNSAGVHKDSNNRTVFRHLIWVNSLVIFLDCSLLALSYANFFYVQSAYKVCVYGVKLRLEFAILNRLIASVHKNSASGYGNGASYNKGPASKHEEIVRMESINRNSTSSGTEILHAEAAVAQDADLDITDYDRRGIRQTVEIYQTTNDTGTEKVFVLDRGQV